MKNEFERALEVGARIASTPDEEVGDGALVVMTRAQAAQKLRKLEHEVDKLVDRIMVLNGQGRTKRATRLYDQAVTKCAAANDLREALDTGHVARVIE